jgi:hypothetical protein
MEGEEKEKEVFERQPLARTIGTFVTVSKGPRMDSLSSYGVHQLSGLSVVALVLLS